MERIRILCFGDSNTWGYDGFTGERFGEEIRWPEVLQQRLGSRFKVIEEGQNGRVIAHDDPCEGEKNAMRYIVPCLETHKPLDLLIIMLGTNDLKARFHLNARDIGAEMRMLVEKIIGFSQFHMKKIPKILIVSPIHVLDQMRSSPFGETFEYQRARDISLKLAEALRYTADLFDCDFFDAASVAQANPADSLHMNREGHLALAEALEGYIRNLKLCCGME